MTDISMRDMLEAGVHFGHRTRYWNPKMAPYIFGSRNRIHIINLEKTVPMFHDALEFLRSVAVNRGKVLFVGTKYAAQQVIAQEAIRCGMPYVDHRWLGGMLTNYKTIRKSIKRLKELEEMAENGLFSGLTKKETLDLMREKEKLGYNLAGIKDMGALPDALVIVDVGHEKIAVEEARHLGIPVVGIVDSNNSPDNIDYVVPGNDDAGRSIRLYARAVADIILASKQKDISQVEIEKTQEELPAEQVKVARKVVAKKAIEVDDEVVDVAENKKVTKKDTVKKVATKKSEGDAKLVGTKPKAKTKSAAKPKTTVEVDAGKEAPSVAD